MQTGSQLFFKSSLLRFSKSASLVMSLLLFNLALDSLCPIQHDAWVKGILATVQCILSGAGFHPRFVKFAKYCIIIYRHFLAKEASSIHKGLPQLVNGAEQENFELEHGQAVNGTPGHLQDQYWMKFVVAQTSVDSSRIHLKINGLHQGFKRKETSLAASWQGHTAKTSRCKNMRRP